MCPEATHDVLYYHNINCYANLRAVPGLLSSSFKRREAGDVQPAC